VKIEDACKHTDYYDFAHAGIDEQVVFRRTHEIGQEPAPGDLPFSPKLNAPYLQRVGFQNVRNAFDVNQDIACYVSGVLPAMANPMVEITDADKVREKNFDEKCQ